MTERFYIYESEESDRAITSVSVERLSEELQERAAEVGIWGAWRAEDGKVTVAFADQYDTVETNIVVSPDGYVFE